MSNAEESTTDGLTQKQIAEILGISRARVYQIEKLALSKLRSAAEARGWKLEHVLNRDVPI